MSPLFVLKDFEVAALACCFANFHSFLDQEKENSCGSRQERTKHTDKKLNLKGLTIPDPMTSLILPLQRLLTQRLHVRY